MLKHAETRGAGCSRVLAAGAAWMTGAAVRSGDRHAEHEERRLAALHRRRARHAVLAARSDQRHQLQQARGRLAVQDRQPRHPPRVQARRHAAGVKGVLYTTAGTRRSVVALDGKHRRADLGAQLPRRQPRRDRAAPAVGPRRLVLDRRQGRRAHPLRHHRLPPGRAQREDRRDDPVVRRERRRRPEEGRRVRQGPADRSGDRRDRPALDADRRQGRRHRRLVVQGRDDGQDRTTTPRVSSARST